jgi:hypothetical protein
MPTLGVASHPDQSKGTDPWHSDPQVLFKLKADIDQTHSPNVVPPIEVPRYLGRLS